MSASTLITRYVLFAIVASLCNLGVQRLVIYTVNHPSRLAVAVVLGTAVGLVVKYALDKRWIFQDMSRGAAAHAKRFSGSTLMGVGTTLLFWGMELGFWTFWKTETMRELGAVLGLSIGYVVK